MERVRAVELESVRFLYRCLADRRVSVGTDVSAAGKSGPVGVPVLATFAKMRDKDVAEIPKICGEGRGRVPLGR